MFFVLKRQTSEWEEINAGVLQGSVLWPLFFLIYINDLTDGTWSIVKLFADDTSLFSVFQNKSNSASQFNNDLNRFIDWPTHGKSLLTQIHQSKHKNWFFQGNVQKRIILPHISIYLKLPIIQTTIGMFLMKS